MTGSADAIGISSRKIGRSRLVVVVAVLAVLLAAFSLFLLGAWLAVATVMLKAVFFYLIGVGFYGLFISPLNVTVALGVETLNDLETKIISVIIVIMAVRFLERSIRRDAPLYPDVEDPIYGRTVLVVTAFSRDRHPRIHRQPANPTGCGASWWCAPSARARCCPRGPRTGRSF